MPLLRFSGKPAKRLVGVDAVNAALRAAGVSIFHAPQPQPRIRALLEKGTVGGLDPDTESPLILHNFQLEREDVLSIAASCGRDVAVPGGGAMATEEAGVPQYPKVYDCGGMGPPETRGEVYRKFALLHVNSTPESVGVDEVMQLVAGGPFTWFFRNPDPELGVMMLTIPAVAAGSPGFRVCYPGLTPHGAFLSPAAGLIVAYITGPPVWNMQYADGDLSANPWVDADAEVPVLLDSPTCMP